MPKSRWKKAHKSSGATVIERKTKRCRLAVIPSYWTRPHGAAVWSTTCGGDHKRGNSSSVKNAKTAASRAANTMRRR